jgi:hypothetical protein
MPVNHSLKTTGNFYTRKYFSIEKNRNQWFFLLIVRPFNVFSLDFLTCGRGGSGGLTIFLLKIPGANVVIPA